MKTGVLKGRVMWFDPAKGYGFIKLPPPDGQVFFHRTEVVDCQILPRYTAVEFEMGDYHGRVCAKNVRPVEVGVQHEVQQ